MSWADKTVGLIAVNESFRSDERGTHDLAGVIGERQFLTIATAEVARARRYGRQLSCLLIDVDLSTTLGGSSGRSDLMLRHFVSICRSMLRASDYMGCVGDQFVVMLPETPLLSAFAAAERILAHLAASTSDELQHHLAAMTSIGVAELDEQIRSLDLLLEAAAAAMTEAKKNGRNQAVCYLDDLPLASTSTVN